MLDRGRRQLDHLDLLDLLEHLDQLGGHHHLMNEDLDDDDFWGSTAAPADRTSQIERVRNSVDRTRTHHVVARRDPPGRFDDDEATMWVEPTPRLTPRLGPLASVDPRLLSVGAVAVAVVLAVPLFGALGGDDGGDSLRAVTEQSTTSTTATTVTTAPPTTATDAVVVTAAVDPEISGESDVDEAIDEGSSESSGGSNAPTADVTEPQGDPTPAPQALRDAPDCANRYTAVAGDYWLRVAGHAGVDLDELLELNAASAETAIYPGSKICLPEGTGSGGGAGGRAATATDGSPAPCANQYATVAGDYWVRIADAAELELDELLELNGATTQTPLFPGDEVCLPAGVAVTAPPTTATPGTTAPPTTAAAVTTPPPTDPPTTPAPTEPPTTAPPTTAPETTVQPAPPAPGEIEQIIRDVWPDDLEEQALRIAFRESSYDPRAQNFCCSGLFQLYFEVHRSWLADLGVDSVEDLYDPRTNAEAAYALFQRSGGWGPWPQTRD